jgi:hypothetical protein
MKTAFDICARALLALSLLLTGTASVHATPPGERAVDLEPRWRVGDHVEYTLKKSGVVTTGGVVRLHTTNTTPVRIDVLQAGPDGFVIGWTMGSTHFDDAATAAMGPLERKMAGVMVGQQLKLRIARSGEIQAVDNWEAIRDLGDAMAAEVSTSLRQAGVDGLKASQASQQIRAMFSTEQSVRLASTREAQLLLLSLGHTYRRMRPTQFEVVVPNPMGSGWAPVVRRFELRRADATASLQWTQSSAVARSSATEDRLKDEARKQAEPDLGPRVSGDCVVDIETGWPSSVTQTISAAAQDAQRTETTSLQRN